MNILLFDKSPEISEQLEKNIKSIADTPSILKASSINDVLTHATKSNFNMVIVDGDNLNGKFRILVDLVKRQRVPTYIVIFFSFNIKIVMEKFTKHGADFCFDKLYGFETFIEVFKSIYENQYKK